MMTGGGYNRRLKRFRAAVPAKNSIWPRTLSRKSVTGEKQMGLKPRMRSSSWSSTNAISTARHH